MKFETENTPREAIGQQGPIACLDHVTLRYERGIVALDDLSLEIASGEWLCVLGANGSGKSTLSSVLSGLLAPDEGTVRLVGEPVLTDGRPDFAAYGRARRALGLVFQNPEDQIVTSVVQDDVAFGPENLGVDPVEIGIRVRRELHRVALERYAKADPSRLSGGQQQRVAIAGALAMEPQLLVLDEPGALLDVRGRRSIMKVMASLHRQGTTLVHVTHFMEEALQADRVLVMDHGRAALLGTPQEVFSHADLLAQLGLERPFWLRLAGELDARGITVPSTCDLLELESAVAQKLRAGAEPSAPKEPREQSQSQPAEKNAPAEAPAGKATTNDETASPSAANSVRTGKSAASYAFAGEPILEVSHVSFGYGSGTGAGRSGLALDDVSFQVSEGAFTAIVGQTGSGKSTLLRILSALEQPDSGFVRIAGINTASKRDRRRIHGLVGYVMQHPERQLFAETVLADVAYGPSNQGLNAHDAQERALEALERVHLLSKADASPFELSGGQKRLAAIAGILAMRPRVLVLDEPTAGLDPRGREQLRSILREVRASGVTIVQVTHSMEDAARADQVIVLNQSKVLADDTPARVFSPQNRQLLADSGLGLPRPLECALALEKNGAPSLGNPLTIEALADAIARGCRANAAAARREA